MSLLQSPLVRLSHILLVLQLVARGLAQTSDKGAASCCPKGAQRTMTDHELTQLQETGHVWLYLSVRHVRLSTILEGLDTLGIEPSNVRLNTTPAGVVELSVINREATA